ncbi:hypothetical protein [Amycolatopsis sp. BJA-103]|uniref:hypothetical protein n=1 Tax=Amycolatopsis sp. BJA-103 TaxID=1911175 RepID=UPI000C757C59|nr:hypothetical protein [Amycolatopsis sp. BJA-103]AUI59042.1 hypothetical protein BKN51_13045 [Amycolatopsis sp. BJA-103]PNE17509.1 hypothetical protein B1H26_21485 [Amycolatopsis sp. BJA-103]
MVGLGLLFGGAATWRQVGVNRDGQAPWQAGTPDGPQHPTPVVDENRPWLRIHSPDIPAAMIILARRPHSCDAPRLYLSRVDLRGADMRARHLTEAILVGARADGTTVWPEDFGPDVRREHGISLAE